MTCNIRISTMGNDRGNALWQNRREFCLETIAKQEADLLCLQECSEVQYSDFQQKFGKDYDSFWVNPYVDFNAPENVFFFRRRYRILTRGGYSLSETPHVVSSKSWQSECVRCANYAVLEDNGKRFRIVNTHIDHASQLARENQARVLCEDADAWAETLPQILTGDLNCDVHNPAIQILLKNGWRDSHAEATGIADERFTFHEFKGEAWHDDLGICGNGKMDWILLKGPARAISSRLVLDHQGSLYPSDHYFVVADIDLAE